MRMRIGKWMAYSFALAVVVLYLTKPVADSSRLLPTQTSEGLIERSWKKEFPSEFVLKQAGIKTGDKVADVGCEWGYFTYDLARHVGPTGKVYAADINPEMVRLVRAGIKLYDLPQIAAIHSRPEDPMLPARELSHVVITNAYHEMTQYRSMLAGIRQSLTPNGRLIIIDRGSDMGLSRQESAELKLHEISPRIVKAELAENGFMLERVVARPNSGIGEFYFLIFRPRT